MSFILDALKKSETERQQQSSAEFSSVPASAGEASSTRWLWLLALLLGVNLVVLIGILMRPDTAPESTARPEPQAAPAELSDPDTAPSFADQVADAVEERAVTSAAAPEAAGTTATTAAAPQQAVSQPSPGSSSIPTIDQLRLDGSLQLAELHLDIHVYSENPDERFVFVNMVKHREQSRLAEGPTVRQITPEGVILDYQGKIFLLPRE